MDKLDIDKLKYVPSDLSSLKSKVDELDIGKLENIPVDLSKLRALIKNDVVKKAEHDELVLIILLKLILRLFKLADWDTKIGEVEKKILIKNWTR